MTFSEICGHLVKFGDRISEIKKIRVTTLAKLEKYQKLKVFGTKFIVVIRSRMVGTKKTSTYRKRRKEKCFKGRPNHVGSALD